MVRPHAIAHCFVLTLGLMVSGCDGSTSETSLDLSPANDLIVAPDADLSDLDTTVSRDAADPDTTVQRDAIPVDTQPGDAGLDTRVTDASMMTDAGWGSCTVGGTAGVCLDIAECDGDRVTTPGFCPGPSEIRCCHEPITNGTCDENEMVVPADDFVEAPGIGGCPAGMVAVTTFCIDQYEAALLQVLGDGSTVPWSPFFNPGATRVRAVSSAGAVPQGYITGTEAAAACAEAGKRLCTDTEWLRACQGSTTTTYPYGNTRQDGVCNDSRSGHPVVEYFMSTADWIWSQLGHPCISQQAETVDPAGANPGCISEDGVYDMMGNLHEWTADPAGTFRGGFYVDTVVNGEGCLYRTTAHSVGHWDYSTGFRCCADGS